MENAWQKFLDEIKNQDIVLYSAISNFKVSKKDEVTVQISYSSESARSEFEKVQSDFFNRFKRKVNNFKIKTEFKMDMALKKEIVTKRTIFEKFAEINPLLNDLDELMKFDFS